MFPVRAIVTTAARNILEAAFGEWRYQLLSVRDCRVWGGASESQGLLPPVTTSEAAWDNQNSPFHHLEAGSPRLRCHWPVLPLDAPAEGPSSLFQLPGVPRHPWSCGHLPQISATVFTQLSSLSVPPQGDWSLDLGFTQVLL